LGNISKDLAAIRQAIEHGQTENNLAFNSQNERFFRDVFSFSYDCHFENTDFGSSVSPHIDLVDHNKKIACQITTTKTKEKLKKTLTSLKTSAYQGYEIKIFCLLDKPYLSGKSIKYINDKFKLNILDYLIDEADLIKLIAKGVAAKNIQPEAEIVVAETEKADSMIEPFQELGVSKAALASFYKILNAQNIPPRNHAQTLRKITRTYLNNLKELASLPAEDAAVQVLLSEAGQVLSQGEFNQAEALINQAKTQDLVAAQELPATANKRFLSAAESAAQNGRLKLAQLKYLEAADYFQEAAKIVPVRFAGKTADYLTAAGSALYEAGQYPEAESVYQRGLVIREKRLGENHAKVVASFNHLATLYRKQGKYGQAEPFLIKALASQEKVLPPFHPAVAKSLNNLASLYDVQNRDVEAAPLYQKAISVAEQALGKDHPATALYRKQYDKFLAKNAKTASHA
jgi:tetratricopeptide (TPR) repeat protein